MRDFELEKNLQSTIDNGNSVWVIGDIHGYDKTFDALIKKLKIKEKDIILCLGDLIDKGPGSLEVLKTVSKSNQILQLQSHSTILLCNLYCKPQIAFYQSINSLPISSQRFSC